MKTMKPELGNQRGCSSLRRCQTIALWRVSERAKSAANLR